MVPGYFLKGDLLTILHEINGSLHVHNLTADMFVYGGAGLLLATPYRTSTGDLDCHVPRKDLLPFFRTFMDSQGRRHGVSEHGLRWYDLNRFDLGGFTAQRDTYFDRLAYSPSVEALGVYTLKSEPQLALKLARGWSKGRDVYDMASLCDALNIKTIDELRAVWDRHAPLLREGQAQDMTPHDLQRKWHEIGFIRRERDPQQKQQFTAVF